MYRSSKSLSPYRVVLIYLLALILVSIHEMDHWVTWVENSFLQTSWSTPAMEFCQSWRVGLDRLGWKSVHAGESRLLAWTQYLPEIGRVTAGPETVIPKMATQATLGPITTAPPDPSQATTAPPTAAPVLISLKNVATANVTANKENRAESGPNRDSSRARIPDGAARIGKKGQMALGTDLTAGMGSFLAIRNVAANRKIYDLPREMPDWPRNGSQSAKNGEGPINRPKVQGDNETPPLSIPMVLAADISSAAKGQINVSSPPPPTPDQSLRLSPDQTPKPAPDQVVKPVPPDRSASQLTGPTSGQASSGKRRPKTILIAGDSMILEGFGVSLQRALKGYPGLNIVREGRYSTGLTRPDYFDWTPYLKELIQKHQPDILIISLGANDPQDILDENRKRYFVASEGWNSLYGSRARDLLKIPADKGILTFWVGLPIMGQAVYGTRIQNLNAVVQKACAASQLCVFVDTWLVLADNSQKYTTYVRDVQGRSVRIRASDNIHLTEAGGDIMVQHFMKAAASHLDMPAKAGEGAPPATPATFTAASGSAQTNPSLEVVTEQRTLVSKARHKSTSYYAFYPKTANNQTFPVWYLLHGAWDDYRAWKDRAETQIREAVQKYGFMIVTPDGDQFGWYTDSPIDPKSRIETYIIQELIPDVEKNLPARPTRRAVAGLSMGGHGALTLALKHPGLFTSASAMSGVMDITKHFGQWHLDRVFGSFKDNAAVWKGHSAFYLATDRREALVNLPVMLSVSTGDPWVLGENRAFHTRLEELGIKHDYVESPGTHDWIYWIAEFPRHAAFHAKYLGL